MDRISQLKAQVYALPDHSRKEIALAADHLSQLQFSFNLGKIDVDLPRMTRGEVIREIERINSYSFQKLAASRNFEAEYRDGEDKEAWALMAKESRIKLLVSSFQLVSRLRSDEPEAWDKVNELIFDD